MGIKEKIQNILRSRNFVIKRISPTRVNGVDFFNDLSIIVKSECPICFDVGANIGQTIDIFQNIFFKPKIFAFEPSSESFQVLLDRKDGNDVLLHNFALGETNSKRQFFNYEESTMNSFLRLGSHLEGVKTKSKETVEIKTIDYVLSGYGINIDLLKIDTQGFDLKVLQGALESFKKNLISNVLVELNFIEMYKNQSDYNEIITFLSKYNLYLVDYYEKHYHNNMLAWCTALFTKR